LIKRIRGSLAARVFLLTAALTAACCLATYLCIMQFAPYIYRHDLSEEDELLPCFAEELARFTKEDAKYAIPEYARIIREESDDEFALRLFRSDGREIAIPNIDPLADWQNAVAGLDSLTGAELRQFDGKETTRRCTLRFEDDAEEYTLLIAKNTDKESQVAEALQKALPVLSAVILAVSVAAAFFCTAYLAAPVRRISKTAERMAALDFSGLCSVRRGDEIGVLAGSLNTLSEKLSSALSELQSANRQLKADIDRERELERQRMSFFSAASHELKTPITIIKGQLQGMLYRVGRYRDRDKYLAQSLETVGALEKTVQELLTISRLDAPGVTCRREALDLSALVEERLAAHDDLFAQGGLTVEESIPQGVHIAGDARLLQKAVDNLLGNAAAYSPAGGSVFINLRKESGGAVLTVENTGVHIPEEEIPKLCEAFYRVERSRNRQTGGTGLGLYIVKTILDLHAAVLAIGNTEKGVIVSVTFPVSTEKTQTIQE